MNAFFRRLILWVTLAGALAAVSPACAAMKQDRLHAMKLLKAIEDADKAAFAANSAAGCGGSAEDSFALLAAQFGARLKRGYAVVSFGEFNRKGQRITLWKIVFRDRGDDALATLCFSDAKVTGFRIQ